MNNTKENDWLLNNISNPDFSISDFKAVGLNATNTSLEDAKVYKNIPLILENPMFQTDGKFDELKFDNIYKYAAQTYNLFADEEYTEDILKQASFHRDNIFADVELRRKGPDIQIIKEHNPLRLRRGVNRLDILEAPTMSKEEIAQTLKVWDGATKTWHESPNDSFWTDFWDTRVLAQWDFDADKDGNPTSDPDKVVYEKGTPKLNENGTYYYENLNGRDVYGRLVLSKFNTLTTDGSAFNKYDFFDSDDIEKSFAGTAMRNIISIAPMFTPISPLYIGTKVALETTKVLATLGKVFTGSDNKFLSAVEGFTKSLEPTTSEYGKENAWSIENFTNLVGDVFTQLYEQRWIFKYAPALFKGGTVMDEAAQTAKFLEFLKGSRNTEEYLKLFKKDPKLFEKLSRELQAGSLAEANKKLEDYMQGYNKLGEIMSKVYMTGITVLDAYGEAKEQGATDIEAALLTLGYAAGEYAILSSDLGKWILPELRMDKEQMRLVIRSLSEGSRKTLNNASKVQKMEYVKKLFKIGQDIAKANYSVGKSGLKATAANALGEGIEEVSEELLYDFAKSVTNLGMWLSGSDTKPLTAWDNMIDRYGMSFVGGMVGGAIFDTLPNLRQARKLNKMKDNEAYQLLVFMIRNGKADKLLKELDKMTLGNKYLSATKMTEGIAGNKVWQQGTDEDNQDLAAKQEIRRVINFVQNTLYSNNASISDDSFLNIQTLNDLRFSALKNSTVAARYLQDYNSLCSNIVDITNKLNDLGGTQQRMENGGPTDELVQLNGEDVNIKNERSKLETQLKESLEKKEAYLRGDLAPEFIYESLFEMSPVLSGNYFSPTFIQYAENKSGRKITEIPENDLKSLEEEYKNWKSYNAKDMIHIAANIHKSIAEKMAPLFQQHSLQYYENVDEQSIQFLKGLQQSILDISKQMTEVSDSDKYLSWATTSKDSPYFNIIAPTLTALGGDMNQFSNIILENIDPQLKALKLREAFNTFLSDNIEKFTLKATALGYINPVVKLELLATIAKADEYFSNKYFDSVDLGEDDVTLAERSRKLKEAKKKIESLYHSNIMEILDLFSISQTDASIRISKIFDDLNSRFYTSEDLSEFNFGEDILDLIKETISILNMFKAQLYGAKVDNLDIDNNFGFNATVNSLSPDFNLPELKSEVADSMILDIEVIKSKFEVFEKLIWANNANALLEHDKTSCAKNIIIYNKLKKLVDYIPDSWENKEVLENALSNSTQLEQLSSFNKLVLNYDESKAVEQEMINLDDAIYTFFNSNLDKMKDPKELKDIINAKNFNIISMDEEVLNSESRDINDTAFIWYLASRAAVKSSNFYSEYKDVIDDDIAPIPTQELATYLGYASILNGGVINNFCDAVNEALKEEAKSPDFKSKYDHIPSLNQDYILDSSVSPRFPNVAFIEGAPGSGKTNGVFLNLVKLLKAKHPEVLKRTYLAHATLKSAEELSKTLNIDGISVFDKAKLMKFIAPEWVETVANSDGSFPIDSNNVFIDDNGIIRSAFKLNELSPENVPSFILIDEVSRYTSLDIDLIDRFSKKYGVPVVVAGDFDQSRAVGKHKIVINNNLVENVVTLFRNNFPRTPKLGVSLRSNNVLVDYNLKELRSKLAKLRTGQQEEVLFRYFLDKTGLYGTKVFNSTNYSIELVKKDIELMLSTLNPGEKIGFVYYDTDTEIYKLLLNATYKDRIDFKQGNSSQGLEGKYYIIDDSNKLSPEEYWSDLYTGISRAKQGSIVLHTKGLGYIAANSDLMEASEGTFTSVSQLSKDAIKGYSEKRRKILNEITLNPEAVVKPIKLDAPKLPTVTENSNTLTSEEIETVTEQGTVEVQVITNNGLPTELEIKDVVLKANEDKEVLEPLLVETNTKEGTTLDLNLLLYTYMTFESGANFENGVLKVSEENKNRIDSYFGLNKLNIQKTEQSFDYTLGLLRSIIFNTKDKGELIKYIKSVLNLNGEVYCTFAFKSSAKQFNNPDWNKFRKELNFPLKYIYSEGEKSKEPMLKTLSIIIGENGLDVLELPLAVLPNPISILKNSKFEVIYNQYKELGRKNPSLGDFEKLKLLNEFLKSNPSIRGANEFSKLLDVYFFNSNGIFFIDDPQWTLANALNSQGPTIVNKMKGADYNSSGLEYDGKWISVKELASIPGMIVSEIKISPKGIYTTSGKSINFVKPGHPFVYVSYDYKLRGDKLEQYYLQQLEDPSLEKKVKLVYVVPPKASVLEYFNNLLNILLKNTKAIKRIGNDFTAYRILKILTALPNFEKSKLNYNNTAYLGIKRLLEQLDSMEDTKSKSKILNEHVDIAGLELNVTGKLALLNYLLSIVYPPSADLTSRVFDVNNYKEILRILSENKIDGIFFNIQYSKDTLNSLSISAIQDPSTYSIDNIPFMVNGKIDSPTFYGNVSPLLDIITSKIKKLGKFDGSVDNPRYLEGKSYKDIKQDITMPQLANLLYLSIPLSVLEEFDVKDLIGKTRDEVIDIYKKSGHLVILLKEVAYVSKKSSQIDLSNATISDLSKIGFNKYKFNVSLQDGLYQGELDLSTSTATLSKILSKVKNQPLQVFLIKSLKEKGVYLNVINAIPGLTFNKVKRTKDILQFNEEINNVRVTKELLGKWENDINPENYLDEYKLAAQNLLDFFRAKLNAKSSINNKDNSCPISIKINF